MSSMRCDEGKTLIWRCLQQMGWTERGTGVDLRMLMHSPKRACQILVEHPALIQYLFSLRKTNLYLGDSSNVIPFHHTVVNLGSSPGQMKHL